MNYALIENGVVTNLIWLYPSNAGEFPNAVHTGDIPVHIGDEYVDGQFYRNGEPLRTLLEETLSENDDMRNALEIVGVKLDEP